MNQRKHDGSVEVRQPESATCSGEKRIGRRKSYQGLGDGGVEKKKREANKESWKRTFVRGESKEGVTA